MPLAMGDADSRARGMKLPAIFQGLLLATMHGLGLDSGRGLRRLATLEWEGGAAGRGGSDLNGGLVTGGRLGTVRARAHL